MESTYVAGPGHPKQGNWHQDRCAGHSPVERYLWLQSLALLLSLSRCLLRHAVQSRDHSHSDNDTGNHSDEDDEGQARADPVHVGEDEGVAVEESEQHKVEQDQVEAEDQNNRLGPDHHKGPVHIVEQAGTEGAGRSRGVGCPVSIVTGQLAQVLRAPFQQNRAEGLGLSEHNHDQRDASDDHGDPVGPHVANLGRVGADHGSQDRTGVGGDGEQGQTEGDLQRLPDIADRATGHRHRDGCEESTDESEGESGAVVWRQRLGHDE